MKNREENGCIARKDCKTKYSNQELKGQLANIEKKLNSTAEELQAAEQEITELRAAVSVLTIDNERLTVENIVSLRNTLIFRI